MQLALSVLGIALGVGVVLAIDLTTLSAERAFVLAAESVGGRATHEIVGGSSGFAEQVYAELRTSHGLRRCAPVVAGDVYLVEDDRRAAAISLLGVDPLAEAPLRPYFAFGSQETGAEFDLVRFLVEPGACAVSARTAAARGWEIGTELFVDSNGRRSTLTVVALLQPRDAVAERGLDQLVVVDVATAQEVLGRIGRLDRVDVVAERVEDLERLRAALPPGVELRSLEQRRAALGEMTRAFRLNLQALSLLTLLVGAFLIFNTVSFSVVRRRRSLGILRALGASRRRLFRVVVGEALVLGCCGAALGVVFGIALAHGLLGLVTRTIRDHYFTVAVTSVEIAPVEIAVVVALGLAVCVAAALAPAWDATRTSPREVLIHTPLESRWRRWSVRSLGLAVLGIALGAGLLMVGGRHLAIAYAGLFAVLIGAACVTPSVCRVIAWMSRPVFAALLGGPGLHAVRGIGTNLSRTAVATSALMVAVATTVGLGSMIASFRGSVARWLGSALRADVYVSAPSGVSERFRVRLDDEAIEGVRAVDGVADLTIYRRFETDGRVGERRIGSVRCVALSGAERIVDTYEPVAGDAPSIHRRFLDGAALVSEPFAFRHGVERGATLELLGRDGWIGVEVAGVFYDYGSEAGYVVLPRWLHEQHFEDEGVSALGLFAAAGIEPGALADRVRAAVAGSRQTITVQSSRALQTASLDVFDRTFAVTGALRLLCVVVAFLGVWSALMSLQLERQREYGVLRALGSTPRQVGAMVTTQTALLGFGAGAWALPVGAALGWILVHVINKRSFGWTLLTFELPIAVAAEALVLATVAATLAGLHPALRFGRIDVVEALRED